MILAAAVKFGELICFLPAPARHHNVLHAFRDNFGEADRTHASYESEVQGFVTDRGEFLGRRAAMQHTKDCGQALIRRAGPGYYQGDELFSEDLW
jgi:hypothetical protein